MRRTANKLHTLAEPSFCQGSPKGLLAFNISAPIYLHASLYRKYAVLGLDSLFYQPTLDVEEFLLKASHRIKKKKDRRGGKSRKTGSRMLRSVRYFAEATRLAFCGTRTKRDAWSHDLVHIM